MTLGTELDHEWLKDAEFKQANETPEPDLALGRQVIAARVRAGMTQVQLAQRMDTTEAAIAHLEGGQTSPSLKTLKKLAAVTGSQLVVRLDEAAA